MGAEYCIVGAAKSNGTDQVKAKLSHVGNACETCCHLTTEGSVSRISRNAEGNSSDKEITYS